MDSTTVGEENFDFFHEYTIFFCFYIIAKIYITKLNKLLK